MADRHKPGDVPVTFRCPKDLREQLDTTTKGSSRSAFIVEAIREKLERDQSRAVHAAHPEAMCSSRRAPMNSV